MDEGQPMESARLRGDDVEQDGDVKANEQNWTGAKDQSLKGVQEYLDSFPAKKQLPDDFLTNATVLLKSCLEDNNFNLYL